MYLNEVGRIVNASIINIPDFVPNSIIHDHIVMPNHLHFIVQMLDVGADIIRPIASTASDNMVASSQCDDAMGQMISAPTYKYSKTLGSIVRGFKAGITKQIGQSVFQRNYYEHIVRDYDDWINIKNYIKTNPQTWDADKLFQKSMAECKEKYKL
jgi:REP element-mobilizing transposase RayT